MEDRLRISISGIRGKVPKALDVEVAAKFSSAFASYLEEGRIAICRDTRFSSQMLSLAAASSILAAGLDYTNFGRIPISFLQFILRSGSYAGGISVSAGHNPLPWNAIVLLNETGHFLEATEGPEVFNIYEAGNFTKAGWQDLGEIEDVSFPIENYLETISRVVNRHGIQEAGFKVVADPCNGVISPFMPDCAEYFGLDLVVINDEPDKAFPHPPEPSPENASQTEAVVKASGADLGFLFNSDGSRISFVDEKGTALSEEFTLPLAFLALEGRIRKAVTTVATSQLADWAAEAIGARLLKTRVGQSAVVHTMAAEEAEVGGEGSGSLAYLPFSPGYDSLLGLVLVLDLMATREKGLSELVSPFPKLHQRKLKIQVPPSRTYGMMDKLETAYASEQPDFTDGIRIQRKNAWFIIRPSSTEFILRVIIEGDDPEVVEAIEDEIRERTEP